MGWRVVPLVSRMRIRYGDGVYDLKDELTCMLGSCACFLRWSRNSIRFEIIIKEHTSIHPKASPRAEHAVNEYVLSSPRHRGGD
jgi:hypothetical protein